QLLATLTHPNIARMLDVGHLENGQPFLAMEYVDGKPIDLFAAKLTVRQKRALFLKVCAAVAYLHRNLVVHRDLKPSNVLVTAEGEPKLLDFRDRKDSRRGDRFDGDPHAHAHSRLRQSRGGNGRDIKYRNRHLLAGRGSIPNSHRQAGSPI